MKVTCPECGAASEHLTVLFEHEDGTALYECEVCGKRFVDET